MLKELFYFIIFPGLLFSMVAGAMLSWFDRKVTARVQFRKGPPLLQSFYDIGKLFGKEIILPKYGSKATFLAAPVIALCSMALAATFILLPAFGLTSGFTGDIIVIFYLLVIPAISFMMGALATGNPLASIGASREMKLIISYELTFLLILSALVIKSGMSLRLSDIIAMQQNNHIFLGSLSGILLFIAAIFSFQAKLNLVPFDVSEAETEIMNGVFIEYSGTAYAIIKLTRFMMLFVLPCLMVILFLGGFNFSGIHILWSVLKILGIVLIVTLIRNFNPRIKINQAMKFFFVWMNLIVVVAILLTLVNL